MSNIKIILSCIGIILITVGCHNRIQVNDHFFIEYMEMYSSIGLSNGRQGFIGDLDMAYWNTDSLVVSGNKGCFLIELKKTKYNDDMIKIDCAEIRKFIKQKPIKTYFKGQLN